MKKTGLFVSLLCLAAAASGTFLYIYTKEHDSKKSEIVHVEVQLGSAEDIIKEQNKISGEYFYSDSVNILLNYPQNWRQIMTEKVFTDDSFFERIDGSTATIPITGELVRQIKGDKSYSGSVLNDYIDHNTTHTAYEKLISKEKDLIFVTPPSDEEQKLAGKKKEPMKLEPVALDGFVFITHIDNPVESLTIEQIKDIYSGKITNWKEVGGNDEKIIPYQREKNSGSQTAMEKFVMTDTELMKAEKELYVEFMGPLIERVAIYENDTCAIGYTYYYYMNNLYRNPRIKMIKINGTAPENENLKNGTYPFTVPYYEVIRESEPDGSTASELFDYMLTDEGQDIVELAGYCSVRGWVNGE